MRTDKLCAFVYCAEIPLIFQQTYCGPEVATVEKEHKSIVVVVLAFIYIIYEYAFPGSPIRV